MEVVAWIGASDLRRIEATRSNCRTPNRGQDTAPAEGQRLSGRTVTPTDSHTWWLIQSAAEKAVDLEVESAYEDDEDFWSTEAATDLSVYMRKWFEEGRDVPILTPAKTKSHPFAERMARLTKSAGQVVGEIERRLT